MEGKTGHTPKQLRLWDQIIPDPVPAVKAAMSEAIKGCPLSRDQIADQMTDMARLAGIGGKVTPSILDKWVAPSAAHVIPLRLLHIFCRVVQSKVPFETYAACFRDARVISDEDHRILQWALSEIEARSARKRAKRRAQEVGIE